MENFFQVIFFIVLIIYYLFGGGSKNKKKPSKPPRKVPRKQPRQVQEQPASFEDLLKEIVQKSQQKKKAKTITPEPTSMSTLEGRSLEKIPTEPEGHSLEIIPTEPEGRSLEKIPDYTSRGRNKMSLIKRDKKEISQTTALLSQKNKLTGKRKAAAFKGLENREDIKQAFILMEILKRKF